MSSSDFVVRPHDGTRRVRLHHGLAGLIGLALSGWACGASYQSIYEGEVRFEHCYRLDEEAGIPLTQRRECWREWTKFYTYGQTRDRLEYALKRQRELTSQIENPSHATREPQPAPLEEPVAAPPPTSPFAPPPHVHDDSRPDGGPQVGPAELVEMFTSGQQPPNQQCLMNCLSRWHACTDTCTDQQAECKEGCHAAFNNCGKGCLSK